MKINNSNKIVTFIKGKNVVENLKQSKFRLKAISTKLLPHFGVLIKLNREAENCIKKE